MKLDSFRVIKLCALSELELSKLNCAHIYSNLLFGNNIWVYNSSRVVQIYLLVQSEFELPWFNSVA